MSYLPSIATAISYDASNRARTGSITTLFDGKTLNQDEPLLWETVGTGLSAWSNNKMSLSAVSNGQYVIRKSKQYFPYFSGKSQQIEMTLDGFQTQPNIIKRMGYFSSTASAPYDTVLDGIILEDDGITKRLKTLRAGTETLNIPMSSWNGDPYVQTYDWSKFTVVMFDFLWLGGAILRMFVKTDRSFTLAHTFNYAGTSADTFTKSPNQCARYEIRSTGGNGAMRPICSQVSTEGSINESGKQRSVNTGFTINTMPTIGTIYPLISLRKTALNRDKSVKITGIQDLVSTTNDQLLVSLILNPTISAPMNYTAVPNSAVEVGLPTVSGGPNNITPTVTAGTGTVLYSFIVTSTSLIPPNILEEDFLSYIGMSISNVSDEVVVCGTPITAGIGNFAVINFKEY